MSAVAKLIVVPEGGRGPFRYLAPVHELKKTGQLTCWIDDHDILLYEYEGQIKAPSNICPHFGGPVGCHKHKDGVFTCLWRKSANGKAAAMVKLLFLADRNQNVAATATDKGEER